MNNLKLVFRAFKINLIHILCRTTCTAHGCESIFLSLWLYRVIPAIWRCVFTSFKQLSEANLPRLERRWSQAILRMWYLVTMASMILIIFTITGVHTTSLVHFQMSRIERGLWSTSGIVMATEVPSVSTCVLLGMSLDNCHAVNYDTARLLCEVISLHDSLLEMQNNKS